MTLDLKRPLAWRSEDGDAAAMLSELQPNILKAHVRDHLSVLLLQFAGRADARTFLGGVAALMKSAKDQLQEVTAYKDAHGPAHRGTPYVGVGLSSEGYEVIDAPRRPADSSFVRGMRDAATRQTLSDPPLSMWEPPYREPIHAIVLVGDATDASVSARRNEVIARLPDSVTVLGEETGRALRDSSDRRIEHFGYIDGRSQPLFLDEDIAEESRTTDGVDVWNPGLGLDRIVVPEPGAPDGSMRFGSYMVFRKLEQNVQLFKEEEQRLAEDLGLEGDDAERAGAMLVGRFEDGTPLTLQDGEGAHSPVMNNFTYGSDEHGTKCPMYAHIRKVNPRAGRRTHLMARRGQTYGVRSDDVDADLPPSSRPTGGVGLLFMAFNADIADQFEYTQQTLANRLGPTSLTDGVDQLIGQGPRDHLTSIAAWGEDKPEKKKTTDAVAQAVTMKGGEYFFMPSLGFLKSLAPG
jgi:Dyp-type peroxidase family